MGKDGFSEGKLSRFPILTIMLVATAPSLLRKQQLYQAPDPDQWTVPRLPHALEAEHHSAQSDVPICTHSASFGHPVFILYRHHNELEYDG